jgi:hypothetical protein
LGAVQGDDADARSSVLLNILFNEPFNPAFLPVARKAVHHPDRSTRDLAECVVYMWGVRFVGDVSAWREGARRRPADATLRYFLIGYDHLKAHLSEPSRRALQENVLWVIDRMPEAGLHRLNLWPSSPECDPAAFDRAARAWRRHVESPPGEARVLGNAARFFERCDPAYSETLYRRAKALQPEDPAGPAALAEFLLQRHPAGWPPPPARAAAAVAEWEEAARLGLTLLRDPSALSQLGYAALLAGEPGKAGAAAGGLLRLASEDRDPARRGRAAHHGHLLLGHLSLGAGEVAESTRHLLEAADLTDVPPFIRTGGPNMWLARKLLDQGERAAVIRYLRACSRFWVSTDHKAEQWVAILERGDEPDFSGNFLQF